MSGSGINSLSTVEVDESNTFTVAGSVGGASSLTKTGAGTLVLSGNNGFSGGMILTAGTLQVSSGDNLGIGTLTLAAGTLNATDNVSFSEAVAVTGSSILSTNDGFTTTLSGTLTGSNNQTLSLSGSGMNSLSTVEVGGSDIFTVGGAIEGSSNLTKIGTGTLILTGTSTYSGNTSITAGTLSLLNGQIESDTTVHSGATLRGNGRIVGNVSSIGGTIRPGNSIGTLTIVDGSLMLDGDSVTQIEIVPGTSNNNSGLAVDESATLAGALVFLVDSGSWASSQSYTFLTASMISGSFDSPYSFSPPIPSSLETSLIPTSTSLTLLIKLASSVGVGIPLTPNQASLFHYISSPLSSSPPISSLLVNLGALNPDQFLAALNSLSPGRDAAVAAFANEVALALGSISTTRLSEKRLMQLMNNRKNEQALAMQHKIALLAQAAQSPMKLTSIKQSKEKEEKKSSNGLWATGFVDLVHQKSDHQNPSFSANAEGSVVGYEYFGETNGVFLASGGYVQMNVDESKNTGNGSSEGGFATLYGTSFISRNWYLEAGMLGAYGSIQNLRNIYVGGPNYPDTIPAKSTTKNWQLMPHFSIGGNYVFNGWAIEPVFSFDYAILYQKSFAEEAEDSLGMKMLFYSPRLLQSAAGLNFYQFQDREKHFFFLEEKVGFINQVVRGGKAQAAIVLAPGTIYPSGTPASFSVLTYNQTLNLLNVGAELFYEYKPLHLFLSATYDGEFGKGFRSHDVQASLGWFF